MQKNWLVTLVVSIIALLTLFVATMAGWQVSLIGVPFFGFMFELRSPSSVNKTIDDDASQENHSSPSTPTKFIEASFSKSSLSIDALLVFSDLPDGEWQIKQERAYTSNIPLSELIKEGALSFVCKKRNVQTNFTDSNILFDMMQVAGKTQDLPPQQFTEWILLTNEATDAQDIFDLMKGSLQSCENVTFVDDAIRVRRSFNAAKFRGYAENVYMLKEQIEPISVNSGNLAYEGTGYSVLLRDGNAVVFLYYMTGHSRFRISHIQELNFITELAVNKLNLFRH